MRHKNKEIILRGKSGLLPENKRATRNLRVVVKSAARCLRASPNSSLIFGWQDFCAKSGLDFGQNRRIQKPKKSFAARQPPGIFEASSDGAAAGFGQNRRIEPGLRLQIQRRDDSQPADAMGKLFGEGQSEFQLSDGVFAGSAGRLYRGARALPFEGIQSFAAILEFAGDCLSRPKNLRRELKNYRLS